MTTTIQVTTEVKNRLKNHIKEGETFEDIITKLLDLDDQYGNSSPVEFEVIFNKDVIKVFRLNNRQFEYFTPTRKFSVSLVDWNLPEEFKHDWIMFATSQEVVPVLFGLGKNTLECASFKIRQI